MKTVHAVASLAPDRGGIAAYVPALLKECAAHGAGVEIVAQSGPAHSQAAVPVNIPLKHAGTRDRSSFGYSSELPRLLRERALASEILHSHGLWMHINYVAPRVACSLRKPHVVSVHGMLEARALSQSSWKKKVARLIFQDRSLESAACIHAVCDGEADSIRALGFKTPIAVIEHGVDLAEYECLPSKEALGERFPELKGRKQILYLARIHPKKGLLPLVDAWARLAAAFPQWDLVIAGPDEAGYRALIQRAVEAHGLSRRVVFTGMMSGTDKLSAFASADLFVLPSQSEVIGLAVLEAMACRLPVLLTPGCNFPEAAAANAAIEVHPDAQSIEVGLRALLQMTDGERRAMGSNGYNLVAADYTWQRAASDMLRVYEWCLGGGAPPDTVRLH